MRIAEPLNDRVSASQNVDGRRPGDMADGQFGRSIPAGGDAIAE
jgi:hypothetical protein